MRLLVLGVDLDRLLKFDIGVLELPLGHVRPAQLGMSLGFPLSLYL